MRESLPHRGWVAMWGPLEVFFYDWWPSRAGARLFDRLAAMPVAMDNATGGCLARRLALGLAGGAGGPSETPGRTQ